MSYCRFSSMNWMCDVYVYEHYAGGWTTHVAGNRLVFHPVPRLPILPSFGAKWDKETRSAVYPSRWRALVAAVWYRAWGASDRLNGWCVIRIPRRTIGLPFDGETFSDSTPGECADRLDWLRGLGYRVPQSAIDALRAEQSDAAGFATMTQAQASAEDRWAQERPAA